MHGIGISDASRRKIIEYKGAGHNSRHRELQGDDFCSCDDLVAIGGNDEVNSLVRAVLRGRPSLP